MAPRLKALHGLLPQAYYPLGELTTIGRADACDVFLPFDGISRSHCVIARRGPRYVLTDQGSRNGTEVNGVKVNECTLAAGDRVLIGPYELEFVQDDTPDARVDFDERPEQGVDITNARASRSQLSPSASPELLFKALQKFQSVLRMSEAIAQVPDGDELFNTLLEQLFTVLPADRGVVLLGSSAEDVRAVAVRTKLDAADRFPISRTLVRRIFAEKDALLVLNLPADKRLESKSLLTQGVRSIACAPLLYDGLVVGAVQLDSAQVGAFAPEDLQILVAITRQAALTVERSRLVERIRHDLVLRIHVDRYLPRDVVRQITGSEPKNKDALPLGRHGTRRKVALLFSKLRGFSEMASKVEARYLLETMNEYFARMVDQVFRYGGTLDKFIGSGVMAFWGAPISCDDDAARAVACALDMQASLIELNAMRSARGQSPLVMSIGVHAGEAVVGSVGSDLRLDYTVLGPTVTFAGQVMGAAQASEVLLSADVHRLLGTRAGGEWRLPLRIKGVDKPVPLFSLHALLANPLAVGTGDDKREVARVHTALPVKVSRGQASGDAEGIMRDLSGAGAGLVLTLPEGDTFSAGGAVDVSFSVEAQAFSLRAEIRRVNRVGIESGNVFHLGIAWTSPADEVEKAIERLIGKSR